MNEGQRDVAGPAEPVAALERARQLLLDLLAVDGARKPRDGDLLQLAGVDADHLV